MRSFRLQHGLPVLAMALLVCAAYGGALANGYVWDDRYFLVDFAWLDSFSSALDTAFSPLFQSESYVRPVPLLSFYVEGLVVGRNPAVSHAVNLTIHLASTSLVYLLARDAIVVQRPGSRATAGALLLAAFFAVHPALSEAVVWVSSRFDLLATFFVLLGLWVSTRSNWRDITVAVGVGACFLLGLLSKESAIVLPPLLAIMLVLRARSSDASGGIWRIFLQRRWLVVLAAGVLAGMTYLLVRYSVLGGLGLAVDGQRADASLMVARIAVTLREYLQLTLIPFVGHAPQHTFVWTMESSLFDFILPVIISIVVILSALLMTVKRWAAGWVLMAWIVCYLPVLHLLPISIGDNSIQQRFMYLPTGVLLAWLPYALMDIPLSLAARRAGQVLLLVLLLSCVLVTRSIVPAWRSDVTLWTWADQVAPRSSMVRENLIWAYLDLGHYEKVDQEVERLRADGIETTINALVNVGASKHRRGQFEEAISLYEYALERAGPGDKARMGSLYVNLAVTYAVVGRDGDARKAIAAALDAVPRVDAALGNFLAFCEGQNIDLSSFERVELQRAQASREIMSRLLAERRGSAGWASLCPGVAALRSAVAAGSEEQHP